MALGRRSVLQLLGIAPFAAPAAINEVRNAIPTSEMMGSVIHDAPDSGSALGLKADSGYRSLTHDDWRLALSDPKLRAEVISDLFANEKRLNPVPHIDPDIDVYRSFSRSAKIAFQRQRRVQQQLYELQVENSLHNIFIRKVRSFLGLKTRD